VVEPVAAPLRLAVPRPSPPPLCPALGELLATAPDGFVPLRAEPLGAERWRGRLVPAPFRDCVVEGTGRFASAYVCRGLERAATGPAPLAAPFDALVAEIDRCLAQPTTAPRQFNRGAGVLLAGGERQIVWRDLSETPAAGVILKLEDDLVAPVWYLRLAVATLR
jgi:hypothetical protein